MFFLLISDLYNKTKLRYHNIKETCMNYTESWNRLCAEHLNGQHKTEIEIKQDWNNYFEELFGYGKGISDIFINGTDEKLFLAEIKQYSMSENSNIKKQIENNLEHKHLSIGILVCDKMYIYCYDFAQKTAIPLSIPFERNNQNGIKFMELFNKQNFNEKKIQEFVLSIYQKTPRVSEIKQKITVDLIKNLLREQFSKEYSKDEFDDAISDIEIKICSNTTIAAPHIGISKTIKNSGTIPDEINKVKNRVPKWFENYEQYNSIILYSFMKLYDTSKGYVKYDELEKNANLGKHFKGNFDQMKNFGEKNHGKIFEQASGDDKIYLWEKTKDFILNLWKKYK